MQQRWVMVALLIAMAAVSWMVLAWPAPEPESEQPSALAPEAASAAPPPMAAGAPSPEPTPEPEPAPQTTVATAEPKAEAEPAPEAPPMFEHDQGPVAEYKKRFESEPRDSAASDAELQVRDAFKLTDSPSPVFRSVLCRKTLCKLEIRMTGDQLGAYVAGMTRLTQHFDKDFAVTRTSDSGGQVSLEVYAQRSPKAE